MGGSLRWHLPRSRFERVPMPASDTRRRCRREPRTRPFPRRGRSVDSQDPRVQRQDRQTAFPHRPQGESASRGSGSTAGLLRAPKRRRWPAQRRRGHGAPRCGPPSLGCLAIRARTEAFPRPAGSGSKQRRAQRLLRGPRLLAHRGSLPRRSAPSARQSRRAQQLAAPETPQTVPGSEESGHAQSVRVRR